MTVRSSACSFDAALGPVALPHHTIDAFTRECLAIRVDRKLRSTGVIDVLSDLFVLRGVPDHIRSELPMVAPLVRATIGDGPEFIAKAAQDWITAAGSKTACIEPGSPWQNGSCESFNAKLRDGLLDGGIFCTLAEAVTVTVTVTGSWRHNTRRPHSSLGYPPPAPEAVQLQAPPSSAAAPATQTAAPRPIMH